MAGARQVGKSTLVGAVRRAYVTLDVATTRVAAAADPDGFVAGLPLPVAVDEVQRVPELFLALKAAIDADRVAGRFLLTGSADVLAIPRVADALPGRMEIVELWPLSQGEISGSREGMVDALFAERLPTWEPELLSREALLERVLRGGFPEVVERDAGRCAAWFDSYLTAIVEREVRDLAAIGNVAELLAMIRLIAARSGRLFNLADVARDAALAHSTARRYLGWFRAVFLVAELRAWAPNAAASVVKSPKLLLVDSGLAAHVIGADVHRLMADGAVVGGLLESFVATELCKQVGWSRIRPSVAHYRSRRGEEVDVVLVARDGSVAGVEVKAGATVRSDDFRGLHALAAAAGPAFRRGIVLHTGAQAVAFGPRMAALPISALWRLGSVEL